MACIIEVRDQELYIFKGKRNKGIMNVSKHFRIYLAQPLFDGDRVIYNDALVEQVREILNKNGVKDRYITLVLNDRIALTKDLIVPKTDKKKLDLIITNEMVALYNLSREFIVDYRVIKDSLSKTDTQIKVLASAVRRNTIAGLEMFFKELGMKIQSIDTAPSTYLKFIDNIELIESNEPTVVVDASSSYLRYYLYNNKEFMLMRTLYIDIEDEASQISTRAIHVLELLAQSQIGLTGKPIGQIKILGYHKRFTLMESLIEEKIGIVPSTPPILALVNKNDKDLYDFGNSMGVS